MSAINHSNELNCAICLEAITTGAKISKHETESSLANAAKEALGKSSAIAPASHVFHRRCFQQWESKRATCPICRVASDIFTHGVQPPSSAELGRQVVLASEKGDENTVRTLLDKGSISPEDRGWAAFVACYQKQHSIAKILQESGPITPYHAFLIDLSSQQQRREEALTEAAKGGDEDGVVAILASGPISQEARGWAAVCAAQQNHQGIKDRILATGPIIPLHRDFIAHFASQS